MRELAGPRGVASGVFADAREHDSHRDACVGANTKTQKYTDARANTQIQTHRRRYTDTDTQTILQFSAPRPAAVAVCPLPAAGCVGMNPMDIDAEGSQHFDSLARVLTPEEESLASDGSGPMRGTKRPCESARLWERLCADRGVPIRCVSARTETQAPNDSDAVESRWGRLSEILSQLEALMTEGQILSESIDMRIHWGGRELIDDIFEWSCDLECVIENPTTSTFQRITRTSRTRSSSCNFNTTCSRSRSSS